MNRTMNEYLKIDPWKIVEERFDAARMKSSESLFALGNGVMGGRANFEERYTGPTLQGNYIGGVYYPDKTRVGWWKNGYPEYFAKVLNAAFWIGVDISIDGETLDAAQVEVLDFYRETDMRRSVLTRRMRVRMRSGAEVAVEAVRFLSLARRELGVVSYSVTPLDRAAEIVFSPTSTPTCATPTPTTTRSSGRRWPPRRTPCGAAPRRAVSRRRGRRP